MIVSSEETRFLLALSMLKGLGPAALRKVASFTNFQELGIGGLAERLPQVARACADPSSWQKALELAEEQIAEARAREARIISALDPGYPSLLAATKDDPFILFVQGALSSTPDRSAAVIGTREPTAHGEKIAVRITSFLVEQGWSIVSGLAIGCDAIAHRTALEGKGHTVAVLAHGLHTIAPARHRKLADEILQSGGALVSEYRFGQDIQKQQYVKRDRTQAGLAQGVVMIQSDLIGGSLHASRAALDYGRWLAVPFPTERDRDQGEPKVQANLTIASGPNFERMNLLRCPEQALQKIIVLRSREDYMCLIDPALAQAAASSRGVQGSFQSETVRHQDFDEQPQSPRPSNRETLVARRKFISLKLKESDALLQCLGEASEESKFEARFELESVLFQMVIFMQEAEQSFERAGKHRAELQNRGSKLSANIAALQAPQTPHNDALPASSLVLQGLGSFSEAVSIGKLRTAFDDFAVSVLEVLQGDEFSPSHAEAKMPVVELTNIRLAEDGREGLRFTAVRKGEEHEFLIAREALADMVGGNVKTETDMKAAFAERADRIEQKVRNALDYQYRAPGGGFIILKTSDFQ